jgi:hypothetical protein
VGGARERDWHGAAVVAAAREQVRGSGGGRLVGVDSGERLRRRTGAGVGERLRSAWGSGGGGARGSRCAAPRRPVCGEQRRMASAAGVGEPARGSSAG